MKFCKMVYVAVVALVMAGMMSAGAVDMRSEDYKAGYENAAGLYKGMGYLDGYLEVTKLFLDMMDKTAAKSPGTELGFFCEYFVDEGAEIYNGQAIEFNNYVDTINTMTKIVLGDNGTDLMFEPAPLFYRI